MTKSRLSDHFALIKQQLASQELLFEYHSTVESMFELILEKDLILYPQSTLRDYLSIIRDLVQKFGI